MAAASISESISTRPRALLLLPSTQHILLFQGGGAKALAMYQGPPLTPAWNANDLAEHFIYEWDVRPASAPPQTMEDEAMKEDDENLVQVAPIADETEEE